MRGYKYIPFFVSCIEEISQKWITTRIMTSDHAGTWSEAPEQGCRSCLDYHHGRIAIHSEDHAPNFLKSLKPAVTCEQEADAAKTSKRCRALHLAGMQYILPGLKQGFDLAMLSKAKNEKDMQLMKVHTCREHVPQEQLS